MGIVRVFVVAITNASCDVTTFIFDNESRAAEYARAKRNDGLKVDALEM